MSISRGFVSPPIWRLQEQVQVRTAKHQGRATSPGRWGPQRPRSAPPDLAVRRWARRGRASDVRSAGHVESDGRPNRPSGRVRSGCGESGAVAGLPSQGRRGSGPGPRCRAGGVASLAVASAPGCRAVLTHRGHPRSGSSPEIPNVWGVRFPLGFDPDWREITRVRTRKPPESLDSGGDAKMAGQVRPYSNFLATISAEEWGARTACLRPDRASGGTGRPA